MNHVGVNLEKPVNISVRAFLQENFTQLKNDIFFRYVLIALVLKGLLFICIVPSVNASKFDFIHAFWGVPPIILQASFVAMILSVGFIFKGRGRIWSFITIDIIITILFIADLWYYRGYSAYLSPHLLKQFANLDNLGDSIISMFRLIDLVFVIDIIGFIFLALRNRSLYKDVKRSIFIFVFLFLGSIGYVVYDHYKVDVYGKGFEGQMIWKSSWSPNQTLSNMGPIGYHIKDVLNYLEESKQYVLSDGEKQEINKWYDEKQENSPDNKYKGMFKGKNLIVLQVESLETFIIGKEVDGQEITPNLNKLLSNSVYFPNIHEQVWNGTSSDSDLIINTSISPVRSGSTFFRYPGNTYNSLPKLMEEKGYSTLAIHPDKGVYWNWMPALKSIGFEKCIDEASFANDERIGLGISDGTYLKQVVPIIAAEKQPFYTFMVTLTSHAPFDIPEEYQDLKLEDKFRDTKLGNYFQSFRYTDKQIGLFLERIDKEIGLDNTVVVVTGDHTGVHKFYQDSITKITPSESWWADKDTRVPLIIYSKDSKGEVININGGQLDTMPTIAYLMGIDEKEFSHTAMGRILVKTNKNYSFLPTGEFIGEGSEVDKEHVLKTTRLGDIMIRSNYFNQNNFRGE